LQGACHELSRLATVNFPGSGISPKRSSWCMAQLLQ
jgi:hypothetical protein